MVWATDSEEEEPTIAMTTSGAGQQSAPAAVDVVWQRHEDFVTLAVTMQHGYQPVSRTLMRSKLFS